MIKLVISTTTGYEKFLSVCLKSLDAANWSDRIIICQSRAFQNSTSLSDYGIKICSTKHIYEYISFNMIAKYIDHPLISDDKYLFIHDTCYTTDSSFFWRELDKLDSLTEDEEKFYYLNNYKKQNIGICSKAFVENYGSQFNTVQKIDKKTAVDFETFPETGDHEKERSEAYLKKCIKLYPHDSLTDETHLPVIECHGAGGVTDMPILKLKKVSGRKNIVNNKIMPCSSVPKVFCNGCCKKCGRCHGHMPHQSPPPPPPPPPPAPPHKKRPQLFWNWRTGSYELRCPDCWEKISLG